jgi:hypothetical protein
VTVIQLALLTADQAQPARAVTPTVPVVALVPTDTDAGVMVNTHGAPACVMVNSSPPAAIVPVRTLVPGLAATV